MEIIGIAIIMHVVALFEVPFDTTLDEIRKQLRKKGFAQAARAVPPELQLLWSANADSCVSLPFPAENFRVSAGTYVAIELAA